MLLPTRDLSSSPGGLAEEQALSEFATTFRGGVASRTTRFPSATQSPGRIPGLESELLESESHEDESIATFFAEAAEALVDLRRRLVEIAQAPAESGRQTMLVELSSRIGSLKGKARLPAVLPVWQLAFALEWLVKQLAGETSRVTPSTLRTVTSALELLGELCRPGLRADLCTTPPIRLLAVDDDAISRYAIAFALKKGINQPDLAEHGEAALTLARQHAYDVIFLDVHMPGMNGFELCPAIHETPGNEVTPVVFVTAQNDFEAHARLELCGGNDLIGKPFLPFEITVKALTLALQRRLLQGNHPVTTASCPAPKAEAAATEHDSRRNGSELTDLRAPWGGLEHSDQSLPTPAEEQIANGFFDRASAHLGQLSDFVQSVAQEGGARPETMVDLYLGINALVPPAEFLKCQPAFQVTAALEALLKKLLEAPERWTPSMGPTITAAVTLLEELCVRGSETNWKNSPPLRMLVVDDDAVSRRIISGALQLAFTRPYSASDGEAALALAAETKFDVIFLDVEMPGMDGFTVCPAIHATLANRHTPVVFVTGHSDLASRKLSVQCGGSDFITKPFLCSELTLKALTFAIRGRLHRTAPAGELPGTRSLLAEVAD
jgi:CheY-like chemotaxis protein